MKLFLILLLCSICGLAQSEDISWYCYYNECSPEDLQLECREKIVDLVEYIEANKSDDVDFCVVEMLEDDLGVEILFTEERTSIPIGIRTGNELSHIKHFTPNYAQKLYEWVGKEAIKRNLIWNKKDIKHIECPQPKG